MARVLIVEDEPLLREMAEINFIERGSEVRSAVNVSQGYCQTKCTAFANMVSAVFRTDGNRLCSAHGLILFIQNGIRAVISAIVWADEPDSG